MLRVFNLQTLKNFRIFNLLLNVVVSNPNWMSERCPLHRDIENISFRACDHDSDRKTLIDFSEFCTQVLDQVRKYRAASYFDLEKAHIGYV